MEENKNYYMLRISHEAHVTYNLLKRNIISLGYSQFAYDENLINNIIEGNGSKFKEGITTWGIWSPSVIGRKVNELINFFEMKKGDIVVIPLPWGEFCVYEIEDARVLKPNELDLSNLKEWGENYNVQLNGANRLEVNKNLVDLGFFKKAKPLIKVWSDCMRYTYADNNLARKMRYHRGTLLNLDDIFESVDKAVRLKNQGEPINISANILKQNIESTYELIQKDLTHDKFERLIKWYFIRCGASDVVIPSKNEKGKIGDADVIASFENIKITIYVQAKFHVGITSDDWGITQINEYVQNKKDLANSANDEDDVKVSWLISFAKFSDDCKNKAVENNVTLIDGLQFTEMILKAGLEKLDVS